VQSTPIATGRLRRPLERPHFFVVFVSFVVKEQKTPCVSVPP
jgi:hypothetical protein